MIYMLDTNTCIYLLRKNPLSVLEISRDKMSRGHETCMSVITYRELLSGGDNKEAAEREELRSLVDALCRRLSYHMLEWNSECDQKFSALKKTFFRKFPNTGLDRVKNDLMIAAHALTLPATVVTNDRDFRRIREAGGPPWETWVR
ncbi:MAG: type II toxin-antitoxin system VapC family toxin [Alphaproteobacteria bacterium]|nr:type II toxin-antitoxin system VapC family toxin [Alphaproteobacteria bacterium]MDA8003940.1 type II toxin-antitoxin system VapC family toxin [Alphaproteobacteria bacterium]MDA8005953.1 type II toxin-antitoxin system VapC family toxin [Alphaproteobacteria bacterium]MDA8013233.1 type II toxin-antitoxin system VapC family toxin [Alphaproteobacteria bacterium]